MASDKPLPPRIHGGLLAAIRLALGVAIIVYLVFWASPNDVASRLSSLPSRIVLLTFGLSLIAQVLIASRLALLARSRDIDLTLRAALGLNLTAMFYGVFLPAGNAASVAFRILRLSSRSTTVGRVLQVVVGDRAFAAVAGSAVGILVYVALGVPRGLTPLLVLTAVASAMSALLWLALARQNARIVTLLRRIRFLRRIGTWSDQAPQAAGERVGESVAQAFLLSAVAHVVGCVVWYLLALAVGIELSPFTIAWIRSFALAVALLPVTMAGLGLREGAAVYYLTALGAGSADALALSLAVFAVTVFGMAVFGGLIESIRLLSRRSPGH